MAKCPLSAILVSVVPVVVSLTALFSVVKLCCCGKDDKADTRSTYQKNKNNTLTQPTDMDNPWIMNTIGTESQSDLSSHSEKLRTSGGQNQDSQPAGGTALSSQINLTSSAKLSLVDNEGVNETKVPPNNDESNNPIAHTEMDTPPVTNATADKSQSNLSLQSEKVSASDLHPEDIGALSSQINLTSSAKLSLVDNEDVNETKVPPNNDESNNPIAHTDMDTPSVTNMTANKSQSDLSPHSKKVRTSGGQNQDSQLVDDTALSSQISLTSRTHLSSVGNKGANESDVLPNSDENNSIQQIDSAEILRTVNFSSQTELSLYLKNAEISDAQQRAFEIINSESKKLKLGESIFSSAKISSDRYHNGTPTPLEVALDLAVENDDLPILPFTLEQIYNEPVPEDLKQSDLGRKPFVVVAGVDALKLYERKQFAQYRNIVQVASQFNALESPDEHPSAVINWIGDHSQGPRASLQSPWAAKQRESAHVKGKLPDAIQGLLGKCVLTDGSKILEKYKNVQFGRNKGRRYNLYENGYLQLFVIKDENDLQTLRDFLCENVGEIKFLSQWVKCGKDGVKQLQVFNAAPSFQALYPSPNWEKTDNRTNLLKEICEIIVASQYKALGKVAAIMSKQAENPPVALHLTLVGQGVFKNPPEVMKTAMQAVADEIEGSNVQVFVHGYKAEEAQRVSDMLEQLGIGTTQL